MQQDLRLKGKRVLITRPAHQAKDLIAKLRRAGAKVTHIPLIEIADPSDGFRSLDRAISRLDQYDWLIFTSQNAVSNFFARYLKRFPPPRRGRVRERVKVGVKFAVVGPSTAVALKKHGIRKVIVPRKDNYSADGLIDVLKKYDFKGERVLFPSAKKAKETLPAWFKKQGAKLTQVEAYQTVMPKNINRPRLKKLIRENKIDSILFYSESAERNFIKVVGQKLGKKHRPSG